MTEAIAQAWALERAREIDSRSPSPLGVSRLGGASRAALARVVREGCTLDGLQLIGDWLELSHDAEWWRSKALHVDGWHAVLKDWQTRARSAALWAAAGRPTGPLPMKSAKAAAVDAFFDDVADARLEVIDVYPVGSRGFDAGTQVRRLLGP